MTKLSALTAFILNFKLSYFIGLHFTFALFGLTWTHLWRHLFLSIEHKGQVWKSNAWVRMNESHLFWGWASLIISSSVRFLYEIKISMFHRFHSTLIFLLHQYHIHILPLLPAKYPGFSSLLSLRPSTPNPLKYWRASVMRGFCYCLILPSGLCAAAGESESENNGLIFGLQSWTELKEWK